MTQESFGLYVHIPFCAQRCDYCAFTTYVGKDDLHERYVDGVLAELKRVTNEGTLPPATSIYFGGGTPSRLAPTLLGRILAAIDRTSNCEISMEVNPEDVSESYLAAVVRLGVNRVSLGIQSVVPHVLSELGRLHRGPDIPTIAQLVHDSGISTWSMDLIVGAKSERDRDLLASLDMVLGNTFRPPHVSCYLLSVEKGTPLSHDPTRHPDDDVLAHRYEMVDSYLAAQGYQWYELSNWSLPGHESRHNQLYWEQGSYLGLGVAAHSYRNRRRSWNVANLETYLARVEAGLDPQGGGEFIDDATQAFEALALHVRTRRGLAAGGHRIDGLAGYLVECEGRLVLTRSGRLLANEITQQLAERSVPSTQKVVMG